MKINKALLVFLTISVIVIIVAFTMIDTISNMFFEATDNLIYLLIPIIFIGYIFVIILASSFKYNKSIKTIDQTIQEVPPRIGVITDILIYAHFSNRSNSVNRFKFCPIVKDLTTNKLYISFKNLNMNVLRTGPSIVSPLSYTLKSLKNNQITIGQQVNLHIKSETGKILRENDTYLIGNYKYKYVGKIADYKITNFPCEFMIFNEKGDNFRNDLNELNIFEGITDFDAYTKL